MTNTIGIRVYRIGVNERGNGTPLSLDHSSLSVSVPNFIARFVKGHTKATRDDDLERSWYFEIKNETSPGSSQGHIHYGTFGFESNFVDSNTKKQNYRRKITDTEEIPLYYEFWCPDKSNFALVAFQSFQGRSCISMVLQQMRSLFETANPQHVLGIKKLQPNDAAGSAYASAPVKSFSLIKRRAPSDIADKYFGSSNCEPVDFQITISAQRKKSLGTLGGLFNSVKGGPNSVIMHDGIEFPEAVAEVRVGNRTRRVGVFGINGDAGVIDVTDSIDFGPDGHPEFDSIKKETDFILRDFYSALSR